MQPYILVVEYLPDEVLAWGAEAIGPAGPVRAACVMRNGHVAFSVGPHMVRRFRVAGEQLEGMLEEMRALWRGPQPSLHYPLLRCTGLSEGAVVYDPLIMRVWSRLSRDEHDGEAV